MSKTQIIDAKNLVNAAGQDPASPEDWFRTKKVDVGVIITGLIYDEDQEYLKHLYRDEDLPYSIWDYERFCDFKRYSENWIPPRMRKLVIPARIGGESVIGISSWAFSSCFPLTSVVIPESVSWIGDDAFENCRALTNVEIPEGVRWIDRRAFSGCSSLTSIAIPVSVKRIDECTFYDCPATLLVHHCSYAETWARERAQKFEIIE